MDRSDIQTNIVQTTPGAAFQFTETYTGPGLQNQTIIQRTTDPIRNRHNKYLLPVILCLSNLATAPATLAESVGVATASPIAKPR